MLGEERGGVGYHEEEVASGTGTRHLVGEHAGQGAVFLYVLRHGVLDHVGKHGHLGVEGVAEGSGEAVEVAVEDGAPAVVGGIGEVVHLVFVHVLVFHHGAVVGTRVHGHEHEVLFEPLEDLFVVAGLDTFGPEVVVVVVSAEAGHADADGVLSAGDDAVFAFGMVFHAEHQSCEHLRVHVGELVGPHVLDDFAGGGGEPAAVADLEVGLDAEGERPAGGVHRHVGLVDPGAGDVHARGDEAGRLLEFGGAACGETLVGVALEHHVAYAALFAEQSFLFASTVGVHHEHVGLHDVEGGHEVHHAVARIDVGVLHIAYGLHHEEPLLFGIDGLVVLVVEDGLVGADANVEVTILGSLAKELDVSRVEQVVTAGNENFHGGGVYD